MNSKHFLVLLFALSLHCTTVFSSNTWVNLVFQNATCIEKDEEGVRRPSKTPPHIQLSLNVSYDDVNKQLLFEDTEENSYTYAILDLSNSVVTEGILNFENLDIIPLNLDWAESGEYTLIIRFGDFEFSGSFEVE